MSILNILKSGDVLFSGQGSVRVEHRTGRASQHANRRRQTSAKITPEAPSAQPSISASTISGRAQEVRLRNERRIVDRTYVNEKAEKFDKTVESIDANAVTVDNFDNVDDEKAADDVFHGQVIIQFAHFNEEGPLKSFAILSFERRTRDRSK